MRYYFHTEDGRIYSDTDGTDLPNLSAACVEATRVLSDLLKDKPGELWEHDFLNLRVADETGLTLFTLNLSVTISAALHGRHPHP